MASYVEEIETVTIPVGDNVIAVLNEGNASDYPDRETRMTSQGRALPF